MSWHLPINPSNTSRSSTTHLAWPVALIVAACTTRRHVSGAPRRRARKRRVGSAHPLRVGHEGELAEVVAGLVHLDGATVQVALHPLDQRLCRPLH